MKKLKTILQSNIFYVSISIILVLYILIFTVFIKYKSIYQDGNVKLNCKIINIKNSDEKASLQLDCNERMQAYYYYNDKEDYNFQVGDLLTLEGNINTPNNNTIPNTFNYKKYLYNNKIYKIITIKKIYNIKHSKNIFKILKNKIAKHCQNSYISLFILGDKSSLDNDIYNMYKNIGVAHLLAISGMHVAVIIKILNFLLSFIKNKIKYFLIITFLFFFAYLVNFTPSVMRVIIFYIINLATKNYNLNLSNLQILFLTSFIILFINPFNIYNLGFLYSFLAVLAILLTIRYQSSNYFINTFKISFFINLLILPITINSNFEINLILFISNIILIPFVSLFFFPLALLTFIFPILNKLFSLTVLALEKIVYLLNYPKCLIIVIPKLNISLIIFYYILVLLYFYYGKKKYLLIILMVLLFSKLLPYLDNNLYVEYLDVGQGDSSLLILPNNKIVMIDTGGNHQYAVASNSIMYLKSLGYSKIDYLILTHGDADHMGDSIYIVNNFKVGNVILNCGEYNDLEKELTKLLNEKNIKYYSCIKKLNIDKYNFFFLNTNLYDNENDNSLVIYLKYQKYKFLFMGDASVKREKDILEKYNLSNIDFLKVGHHGSNTSSGDEFISNLKPKYSLISVGKNNRYGHPKNSVLDILKNNNSEIYRTDVDGSIEIKIKSDGYSIEMCKP